MSVDTRVNVLVTLTSAILIVLNKYSPLLARVSSPDFVSLNVTVPRVFASTTKS